ncbi:unnamed protein product [Lactuca virosa]|uniref:DC1 domain-containing protein n=1 Tax=Lactuca virosa TaxID=75947 RepID=A0AAU9NDY6_9ASTR|nr:unnamed protein product [Lactuca virosa]
MEVLKVYEHEHPLTLVNLQVHYEEEVEEEEEDGDDDDEEEEKEEEGGDTIIKDGFQGVTCGWCGEEISMYHKCYYKWIFFLCATCTNFTIHNDCAFLPEKLLIQEKTDEYVVGILVRIIGFTNAINVSTMPIWIAQHQEQSHSCPSSCLLALAEPTKIMKMLTILIFFISRSLMKHTAYQNTCSSNKMITRFRFRGFAITLLSMSGALDTPQ